MRIPINMSILEILNLFFFFFFFLLLLLFEYISPPALYLLNGWTPVKGVLDRRFESAFQNADSGGGGGGTRFCLSSSEMQSPPAGSISYITYHTYYTILLYCTSTYYTAYPTCTYYKYVTIIGESSKKLLMIKWDSNFSTPSSRNPTYIWARIFFKIESNV